MYEAIAAEAVRTSAAAHRLVRIAVACEGPDLAFEALVGRNAQDAVPRVDAEAWSELEYVAYCYVMPNFRP